MNAFPLDYWIQEIPNRTIEQTPPLTPKKKSKSYPELHHDWICLVIRQPTCYVLRWRITKQIQSLAIETLWKKGGLEGSVHKALLNIS